MSLWDLYQHQQIRSMQRSQALAEQGARLREQRIERDTEQLEERLDQLATIVEALWSLCRDKLATTDDELRAAIDAIVDARAAAIARGPARCTGCGAAIGLDLDKCQFCGLPSPRPTTPFAGT
jgi:hypothetical protein